MKIGIIFGEENKIYEPGIAERTEYFGHPESFATFTKFYPEEIFAWLSPYSIDYEICKQLDLAIYYSGPITDLHFVKVMDDISCPIACMEVCGYQNLTHEAFGNVLMHLRILDKCDFILGCDEWAVSVFGLYTNTLVIEMPLPMPVELAIEVVAEPSNAPQHDIVVAYGPHISQHAARNGHLVSLLAQEIVNKIDGFGNAAIFNMSLTNDELNESIFFLTELGCKDFTLYSTTPYKKFAQILSKAKLGINLDFMRGAGKFAVDCAILRKPAILSETSAYALDIYRDIPRAVQNPLDVGEAINTAAFVAAGSWKQEWLDKAYERALQYTIARSARILEQAVME